MLEESSIEENRIQYDIPMKKYTTFKIGGPADILIRIKTVDELKSILKLSEVSRIPITVIGNGSNILVKDEGIRGIVLKIEIKKFEILEDKSQKVLITVGSGNKLGEIAQKLCSKEISGFEFAAGIPGTIGGAIRMNAGAYGSEMKDIVKTITYMDRAGEIHKINNAEAKFEYRKSLFSTQDHIITEVELELAKGKLEEIQNKMKEYAESRKDKQPIEFPSAGSTFKRGEDFITAQLIDECGLKGYTVGGAQVSEKHAGFVVNIGNATAKDVIELTEYVKKKVYEKFNKKIELEIEIV